MGLQIFVQIGTEGEFYLISSNIGSNSYTKVEIATLEYGENNLQFNLGQYNWSYSYLTDLYYRDSESLDFIKMPDYTTYIYKFGTVEYVFLALTDISLLVVAVSTPIYIVKQHKAKKDAPVLSSIEPNKE